MTPFGTIGGMGVADIGELREEAIPAVRAARKVAAPSSAGLAAAALSLQRSAGNRATAAWASAVSQPPAAQGQAKGPDQRVYRERGMDERRRRDERAA
jgi:hypothetical protein